MRQPATRSMSLRALLLAAGAALPTSAFAQTLTDPTLAIDVVATGFTQPTTMAFLGSDPADFFVLQKASGEVFRVVAGVATQVLNLNVNNGSERGLLGIALHPDFASNGYVYLYYSRTSSTTGDTSTSGTWTENRVSRFTWNGTILDPSSEILILSTPRDTSQSNGPNHDGGIILFGPDGKLYGVTGDLNRGRFSNPRIEQNTSTTAVADVGGIFRLNDDGSIPADNPFAAHTAPAIQRLYAYGVRNSFGMGLDCWANDRALWMTENGPTIYDEINRTYSGWNSGWLRIMGPDSRNATYSENSSTAWNAADLTILPGSAYSDPEFSFLSPNGIAAIAFATSYKLPLSSRGRCFVGENNFGDLYRFEMNAARDAFVLSGGVADLVADSTAERQSVRIGSGFSVTTDIKVGPDGNLYLVQLGTGRVLRLRAAAAVCLADYNSDGTLDAFDYDDFTSDFFSGFNRADFNGDCVLDAFDYDDFVSEFFNPTGC